MQTSSSSISRVYFDQVSSKARIAAKSRTFLVKVKAYRGEPLNEGADDLAEADRAMEKEGENFQVSRTDNTGGVSIL